MKLLGSVLLDRCDRYCGRVIPLGNDDYLVSVEPDAGEWGTLCDPKVPTLWLAMATAQDMFDELTGGYV